MVININKKIYNDNCISKAIYSLSGEFEVRRNTCGENEELLIIPNPWTSLNEEQILRLFYQRLNDYKLRTIIEQETHDIKIILYAKAFADYDDVSENDLK